MTEFFSCSTPKIAIIECIFDNLAFGIYLVRQRFSECNLRRRLSIRCLLLFLLVTLSFLLLVSLGLAPKKLLLQIHSLLLGWPSGFKSIPSLSPSSSSSSPSVSLSVAPWISPLAAAGLGGLTSAIAAGCDDSIQGVRVANISIPISLPFGPLR